MTPFFLMLGVFALLHLPGLRTWPGGARPADKAAGAMGLVILMTGVLHFTDPAPFREMVPPFLPWPDAIVAASGVAEIALAAGLLVPRTRRLAGWFGVLLFVAIWPANVYTAVSGNYPAGFSQSPVHHWLRVPFQLLYIGWAAWTALGHLPGLGFRQRMMARYYDRVQRGYDAWMAPRREAMLSGLSGTVLEIGPGTGASFAFLPRGIRWIGLEPNVHMHAQLQARAAEAGIDAECRVAGADGMDLPDASIDVVVSGLVLCTVPEPARVLAGIRRVLKPGGRLVFLEHVAAPVGTGLRRFQRFMRPFWTFCADGCNPDRETEALIRAAGFAAVEIEAFEAPRDVVPRFVSPHITGYAING